MADALERLFRDPELARRLAARGRAHVLARYNLLRNAARLRDYLMAAAADGAVAVPREERRALTRRVPARRQAPRALEYVPPSPQDPTTAGTP